MNNKIDSKNSRPHKNGRLFFILLLCLIGGVLNLYGHASPNSLVIVDVAPTEIHMEVQLPIPELELAFGKPLSKSPETVISEYRDALEAYILQHIKAYATPNKPWEVRITELNLKKGLYEDQITPYWEVVASLVIIPAENEDVRDFYLAYDVIMHQVMNHMAFVAIKSDWAQGNLGEAYEEQNAINEANVIAWDLKENTIPPLHIQLKKGTYWKGVKAMIALGMHHISDGTDHLLFLLVLLLPAPLLVQNKRWATFKGFRNSAKLLLKIITAFTIGHSITLLFGALGWYHIPQTPVEILIAVSIVIAGIHAIYPLFPKREVFIAASFGLIHGMAFATTIANMKLDSWTMVLSIFGFNVGIELMQLAIVLCIVPWLLLMSKTPYYTWFRVPVAFLTIIAALAWVLERWLHKTNVITEQLTTVTVYHKYILAVVICIALGMYILSKVTWRQQSKRF